MGLTVSFNDAVTGERVNAPSQEVRQLPLTGWQPLRAPKSPQGGRAKAGLHYMSRLDAHVAFESRLGGWALLLADWQETGLGAVIPQPCRVNFGRVTKPRTHVPDFLFLYQDARPVLVDVSQSEPSSESLRRIVLDLTAAWCEEVGWEYRWAIEPDPVFAQTLRFMAGVRHARYAPLDAEVQQAEDILAREGAMPWAELESRLEGLGVEPWLVPAVIRRGVWTHALIVEMAVPLTASTIVRARRNGEVVL